MRAARFCAASCVVVEAAVFALATRNVATALIAVGIVAFALLNRERRIVLAKGGQGALIATIGLFVTLWAVVAPYDRPGPFDFWGDAIDPISGVFTYPAIAHGVGQFALLFQACQLFIAPKFAPGTSQMIRVLWGLDTMFPFYAVPVLVSAGDLIASRSLQIVFFGGSVLCVLFASLYFANLRRRDGEAHRVTWIWSGATLIVSIVIASFLSGATLAYGHRAEMLIGRYLIRMPQQVVGFSGQSSLGNIANMQLSGDGVALRVYAEQSPGYLRGRAYNTLAGPSWFAKGQSKSIAPEATKVPAMKTFRIEEGEVEPNRELEVWPNSNLPAIIFQSENVLAVGTYSDALAIDSADNIRVDKTEAYRLDVGEVSAPANESDQELQRCLAVPEYLEPGVAELSAEILDGTDSALVAGARLSQYFSREYTYKIGIEIPMDREAISYFLLDKPPAHCEYFAAGATMLLRIAGYPARYATGFVVAEESGLGDYWIARSRHAHAWCEVYDPEEGWVIVEATPADGIPEVAEVSTFREWREYLGHFGHRLKAAIVALDIRALMTLVATRGGVLLVAVVLVIAVIAMRPYWKRLKFSRTRPTARVVERELSPHVIALRALLTREDEAVKALGFQRGPGETFQAFAYRLAEGGHDRIAAWYRAYEAARFSGDTHRETFEWLEKEVSSD